MILGRLSSSCNDLAHRKMLHFIFVFCFVDLTATTFASNINKPAAAVIEHALEDHRDLQRSSISKSRIVPLKRKMDLASTETSTKSKPQRELAQKPPKTSLTDSDQKNKQINVPQEKIKVKAEGGKQASGIPQTEESWDSANVRYDQTDPAKSVTQGVRVEDIIEPTFDYRYSNARRKNPFIPEVILSGKVALQRDLSPNDVEIPIVSPLQSFPVARLAVIGVWETDTGVWKALIRTPATQGIEAKLGDPIGNSGGRLMTINPDSVVVREFSLRSDGTREYRDIPMYMGSDLPAVSDDKVGGRLILRPGATQPEIIPPQAGQGSPTDSILTVTPQAVRGDRPGTLKTLESLPPVPPSMDAPSGAAATGVPAARAGVPGFSSVPNGTNATSLNASSSSSSEIVNPPEATPVSAIPSESSNGTFNMEQGTPEMGGQQ